MPPLGASEQLAVGLKDPLPTGATDQTTVPVTLVALLAGETVSLTVAVQETLAGTTTEVGVHVTVVLVLCRVEVVGAGVGVGVNVGAGVGVGVGIGVAVGVANGSNAGGFGASNGRRKPK